MSMYLKELWRYPVKSMRGESLSQAEIAVDGIVGDRLVHVQNVRGLTTARSHPDLLGLAATTDDAGEIRVEGFPWRDRGADELVKQAVGPDGHLMASASPDRFDVLPLLVATDGAIAAFGRDGRRLRPNIVIGGVDGLTERTWEGRAMLIGSVVVYLDSLRQRCIVTTYDPDTLQRDGEVLRDIHRRFGGLLALNTAVLRPGSARVDDPVRLLSSDETDALRHARGAATRSSRPR